MVDGFRQSINHNVCKDLLHKSIITINAVQLGVCLPDASRVRHEPRYAKLFQKPSLSCSELASVDFLSSTALADPMLAKGGGAAGQPQSCQKETLLRLQ